MKEFWTKKRKFNLASLFFNFGKKRKGKGDEENGIGKKDDIRKGVLSTNTKEIKEG